MTRKNFTFRKKNKYQRHNKNKQQKQQKQQKKQVTRKGKGLLSRLLSRRKKRIETFKQNDNVNDAKKQLATYLANKKANNPENVHYIIHDLTYKELQKLN